MIITLKKTKILIPLVVLFFITSINSFASPGYLGIMVQNLSPPMKTALGITHGILVTQVLEDSPASRAGLKPGDIITRINNTEVKEISDLLIELQKETRGKIKLIIITGGKKHKVSMNPATSKPKKFKWHYRLDRYGDSFDHPFFNDFKNNELEKIKKDIKRLEKKVDRLYKELDKKHDP